MALSRNQQAILNIHDEASKILNQIMSLQMGRGDLSATDMPLLCPSNLPDPGTVPDDEMQCQLLAWLDYLMAALNCAAATDIVACMNTACSDYDDASEACKP